MIVLSGPAYMDAVAINTGDGWTPNPQLSPLMPTVPIATTSSTGTSLSTWLLLGLAGFVGYKLFFAKPTPTEAQSA